MQSPQEMAYNDLGSRKTASPSKNKGDMAKQRTQSVYSGVKKDLVIDSNATPGVSNFTSPLSMKNASKTSKLLRQE
tara:strand:+ start:948 stop:1175 length:228 start_codon:yes stop_codon:yes gene_type:complete